MQSPSEVKSVAKQIVTPEGYPDISKEKKLLYAAGYLIAFSYLKNSGCKGTAFSSYSKIILKNDILFLIIVYSFVNLYSLFMKKKQLRDRIEYLMKVKGISSVSDIVPLGDSLYQKVYRQLFNNKESDITYDVLLVVLEKYPDVSADWLIRGEGVWERTKIVTPPTHRQDIHIEGGPAAISQSGEVRFDGDEESQQEAMSSIIEEKDKIIASLQHDIEVLKEAIRVLNK